jgi:DNA ligase-1
MQVRTLDSEEFNGLKLAADWIRDLESSDSRLHKESVIEKALVAARLGSTNAQCFLHNCYLAYNPFFVYNVKQVPETTGLVDCPNPWPKFWGLLEALRTRSISGHRARDAIADVSKLFDSVLWNNLCRRVLIKDLRCGISEKTLNKVLRNTDWVIPTFTCQLAQDSNDHPAKLKGRKRLEIKLDGVRVIAICYKEGAINLFSRNGKPFTNFPHIEEQLTSITRELSMAAFGKYIDFVLDGEIIGESFQALMKQTQRKSDVDASDSKYFVFDVMPKDSFFEGHYNAQQHKRIDMLHTMFNKVDDSTLAPDVQITPGLEVDLNTAEGHDVMRRYAEDSVAKGFEGIMIKDQEAPYECRRSSNWLKTKPVLSVDLSIVALEEGTGKNVGKLGALVCEGIDNGKHIRVNVGSGLTDAQRDEFWNNQSFVIGQTAEILCDVITQNQDGGYSLRFPRFLRFRDDK